MPQDCVWRHATSMRVMQVRNMETDVCVPHVTEKRIVVMEIVWFWWQLGDNSDEGVKNMFLQNGDYLVYIAVQTIHVT